MFIKTSLLALAGAAFVVVGASSFAQAEDSAQAASQTSNANTASPAMQPKMAPAKMAPKMHKKPKHKAM